MTNKYEAAMVFSVTNGEDAVAALFEKFKKLIEDNGTIENIDEWGKRKLAYPINDELEGQYYIVDFASDATFPAGLDRVAKITDGVLRLMVTKK